MIRCVCVCVCVCVRACVRACVCVSICCWQCSSRIQGEKEMYTLGISNFPIPGERGFPLNAMYTKPANRAEDGKDPG